MRRNVRGEVRIDPSDGGADIEYSLSSVWRLLDQSLSLAAKMEPTSTPAQAGLRPSVKFVLFVLSRSACSEHHTLLNSLLSSQWANAMLPLVAESTFQWRNLIIGKWEESTDISRSRSGRICVNSQQFRF